MIDGERRPQVNPDSERRIRSGVSKPSKIAAERRSMLSLIYKGDIPLIKEVLQEVFGQQFSSTVISNDFAFLRRQGYPIPRKKTGHKKDTQTSKKDETKRRALLDLFYRGFTGEEIKNLLGSSSNGLLTKLRKDNYIVGSKPTKDQPRIINRRRHEPAVVLAQKFGLSEKTVVEIWNLFQEDIIAKIQNPNFQRTFNENPSASKEVQAYLNTLANSVLVDVVIDIIDGLSLWDANATITALSMLSLIPFEKIDPTVETWGAIKNAYVDSLRTQSEPTSSNLRIDHLLDAGKILAPYLGTNIENPGEVNKALSSLHIETELQEGQSVHPGVDPRVKAIQTAIGLIYIEGHAYGKFEKYTGTMHMLYYNNPDITIPEIRGRIVAMEPLSKSEEVTQRRQFVFFNEITSENDVTQEIRTTPYDRHWLITHGLIEKRIYKGRRPRPPSPKVAQRRQRVLADLQKGTYYSIKDIAQREKVSTTTIYNDRQWLINHGLMDKSNDRKMPAKERTEYLLKLFKILFLLGASEDEMKAISGMNSIKGYLTRLRYSQEIAGRKPSEVTGTYVHDDYIRGYTIEEIARRSELSVSTVTGILSLPPEFFQSDRRQELLATHVINDIIQNVL